jgi:hypothetical protein
VCEGDLSADAVPDHKIHELRLFTEGLLDGNWWMLECLFIAHTSAQRAGHMPFEVNAERRSEGRTDGGTEVSREQQSLDLEDQWLRQEHSSACVSLTLYQSPLWLRLAEWRREFLTKHAVRFLLQYVKHQLLRRFDLLLQKRHYQVIRLLIEGVRENYRCLCCECRRLTAVDRLVSLCFSPF